MFRHRRSSANYSSVGDRYDFITTITWSQCLYVVSSRLVSHLQYYRHDFRHHSRPQIQFRHHASCTTCKQNADPQKIIYNRADSVTRRMWETRSFTAWYGWLRTNDCSPLLEIFARCLIISSPVSIGNVLGFSNHYLRSQLHLHGIWIAE